MNIDVHQNAIRILDHLLSLSGAQIINLGPEKDPDDIVNQTEKFKVDAILISTHNGNALQYAQNLKKKLKRNKTTIPVIIGGRLNQKVENQALPIDVCQDLKALGFLPCSQLGEPCLYGTGGVDVELALGPVIGSIIAPYYRAYSKPHPYKTRH